jgi:hypothetical protein
MKSLFVFFITLASAAAQEPPEKGAIGVAVKAELEKVLAESKVLGINGAMMGPAVKGVPYSAVEVVESTQMLADGTRIHNEHQTSVWRDSEGRVRRETPDQVSIFDPTNNTTYFLDTKNQTGQKATMKRMLVIKDGAAPASITMRVEGPNYLRELPADGNALFYAASSKAKLDAEKKASKREAGKAESLGQQMVSGVPCEGTRNTTTIEAGAIGNDRPIQVVSERWYSAELQTVVMTKRTDPRSGEEIFRLNNVSRNEPPATLFEVPANYQIIREDIRGPKQ